MIQPQHEDVMAAILGLLKRENHEAKRDARTWTARLLTEQLATHVLIVSTSPEMDLEINRKLETQLKAMGVEFALTVPMPVSGEPDPVGS
ncbi:MAG: hypothetical protein WEF86_02165 [Gemmatimonadota bacterium]